MKKKNKTLQERELEEFKEKLKPFDEKDFRGHSDFQKLTMREKLEWLSELIYFRHLASKAKKEETDEN